MTKSIFISGIASLLLLSCGTETESNDQKEEVPAEVCTYAYDETSTVLTWTAFKLTDKIGVNGTFDQINVTATNDAEDMFAVLTGAGFEIPVASLNSQDPNRDFKLKNSFFGNLDTTLMISGTVTSIDASLASLAITMNSITHEYEAGVVVEGETITVSTTIDILDFNGQTALDSLSVVCAEKHTGEDGVNKLWSDVDVVVKTTLIKTCK